MLEKNNTPDIFDPSITVPLSKEYYKLKFREKTPRIIEIEAQNAKNRIAAIQEILQEQVQAVVTVKDKKLLDKFNIGKEV